MLRMNNSNAFSIFFVYILNNEKKIKKLVSFFVNNLIFGITIFN